MRLFAIVLAAGVLVSVPACKKKKEEEAAGAGGPIGYSRSQRDMLRKSENNLKQIGLALHAYHDANGHFPHHTRGKDGKPALSWRVAILPYLEEGGLYQQFKQDEPWDGEHNRALVARMPRVYLPPGVADYNGHTFYRAFSGPGAFLPAIPKQSGPPGFPGAPFRGIRMSEVTDGTSNTIMVAEAAEPVIWTKPEELDFDPNGPPPRIGGIFVEGANALLMDGSVRFVESSTSPLTLKALITTSGGEVIRDD